MTIAYGSKNHLLLDDPPSTRVGGPLQSMKSIEDMIGGIDKNPISSKHQKKPLMFEEYGCWLQWYGSDVFWYFWAYLKIGNIIISPPVDFDMAHL